eukprot:gene6034-biopygen11819
MCDYKRDPLPLALGRGARPAALEPLFAAHPGGNDSGRKLTLAGDALQKDAEADRTRGLSFFPVAVDWVLTYQHMRAIYRMVGGAVANVYAGSYSFLCRQRHTASNALGFVGPATP